MFEAEILGTCSMWDILYAYIWLLI